MNNRRLFFQIKNKISSKALLNRFLELFEVKPRVY